MNGQAAIFTLFNLSDSQIFFLAFENTFAVWIWISICLSIFSDQYSSFLTYIYFVISPTVKDAQAFVLPYDFRAFMDVNILVTIAYY